MDTTRLESELPAMRQRLMRQARLAVHDSAHAEDLVQDTLIAVVQQCAPYRGNAALSTWAINSTTPAIGAKQCPSGNSRSKPASAGR